MTYNSILAFGDSFVAGAELDGPESTEVKDQAFPALLGKMLNVPVYNHGWTGGSNQRSIRLLLEKTLEHPNSLVIFFYTEFSRNEYFRPDLPSYLPTDPTGYSPLGLSWNHKSIDPLCRKLNQIYFKNFYHDTSEYNNYLEYNSILTVQLICERFAKDYVQIFGFPGCLNEKVSNQKIILDNIDQSKILKFPGNVWTPNGWNKGFGNIFEWAQLNKIKVGVGRHILHEGHQALADLIKQHLEYKQ